MKNRNCCSVAVVFTMLFMGNMPISASEPHVAFTVKDGWVEMAISHDANPVPEATFQIYSSNAQLFAEGETGKEGRAEFPLPPGPYFRVELKIDGRNADSIQLTKIEDYVVPARVLLSFGIAPCCKVPDRTADGDRSSAPATENSSLFPFSLPMWVRACGAISLTIIGAYMLLGSRRTS
ncbi:MAG: SpaA isopeptide-forming pilin-related protein [Zavarzinella sp.]